MKLQPKEPQRAFTLVELIVVLALLALLAAMLLPAMAGTKLRSRTAGCLDNQRQLALGWRMYAEDNSDKMVSMANNYGSSNTPPWYINPDNYNPSLHSPPTPLPIATNNHDAQVRFDELGYRQGALYRYAQNPRVIHCPADSRILQATRHGYVSYSGADPLGGNTGYALKKVSELQNPAERWLWIEENDPRNVTVQGRTIWETLGSWGINSSVDLSQVAQGNYSTCRWWDGPAVFHFNSSVFSYADGHAAVYHWQDDATLFFAASTDPAKSAHPIITPTGGGPNGTGSPNDLPFVFSRIATIYNP